MSKIITESEVEQVALDILSELEYKVIYGPDIAPEESGATLIPDPSPRGRREEELLGDKPNSSPRGRRGSCAAIPNHSLGGRREALSRRL